MAGSRGIRSKMVWLCIAALVSAQGQDGMGMTPAALPRQQVKSWAKPCPEDMVPHGAFCVHHSQRGITKRCRYWLVKDETVDYVRPGIELTSNCPRGTTCQTTTPDQFGPWSVFQNRPRPEIACVPKPREQSCGDPAAINAVAGPRKPTKKRRKYPPLEDYSAPPKRPRRASAAAASTSRAGRLRVRPVQTPETENTPAAQVEPVVHPQERSNEPADDFSIDFDFDPEWIYAVCFGDDDDTQASSSRSSFGGGLSDPPP